MPNVEFYKLQALGNDFVLIDRRKFLKNKSKKDLSRIAARICLPKEGVGADGVLFIESFSKSGFRMRIFNADGSEAQMCGNGACCVALWRFLTIKQKSKEIEFNTKAGLIKAQLKGKIKSKKTLATAKIKTKTTDPYGLKEDIRLTVLGRKIKGNFINTGVPHLVVFVEGLGLIDVRAIGQAIRNNKFFKPQGTNVNFVEVKKSKIELRTYERGVEAETLACGTGSIASAIIYSLKKSGKNNSLESVDVKTKGGQVLTVSFGRSGKKIKNVWIEGEASLVFKGKVKL